MILKSMTYEDCEQVRIWRNADLSGHRTPYMLTSEMQGEFYYKVICNRQANSRYWGIAIEVKAKECVKKEWIDGTPCFDIFDYDKLIFIGMGELTNIQWENGIAEIGLTMEPGKYEEYGEEAIGLILTEGFGSLRLENIYGEVYESSSNHKFWIKQVNKYSAKMVILPNRKFLNNRFYDSEYFNITKEGFYAANNT